MLAEEVVLLYLKSVQVKFKKRFGQMSWKTPTRKTDG
jgi:hypothetical protein